MMLPPGFDDLPPCKVLPNPVLPVRDCSFDGRTWADGAYRVTGKICQLCSHGSWADRNNRGPGADPKCSAPDPPSDGSHLRLDARNDCDTATPAPTSGFAIRLHEGKCEHCVLAAWSEVNPFSCNVPLLELPRAEARAGEFWLGNTVYTALSDGDFDEVQAYIDSILRDDKRLANGTRMDWGLVQGYANAAELLGHWDEQLLRIQQWRTAQPEYGPAALIEASYWTAYAWSARGHDFAANVPEQAFKTADERLNRARAVLEDAKPYAGANPAWYASMLGIAVFQGWPRAERLALFNEAVAAAPLYDPIYLSMAWGLTPKWGGSLDDYHRFVRAAVEKTKPAEGNMMYARLYWYLAGMEWDTDPFVGLKIPWRNMKRGFDDLVSRYPNSQWNLQHYAYFACRAGDGKTFNALLPRLTARLPQDAAASAPWRDLYTRDYCIARFSKGTHRSAPSAR